MKCNVPAKKERREEQVLFSFFFFVRTLLYDIQAFFLLLYIEQRRAIGFSTHNIYMMWGTFETMIFN